MSLTALRPYLTVSGFSCDSRESVPKSPCFYFPQVKENRASYHKEANQAWRTNRDKQLILRGKNRENITFLPEEEEGAVLDHHPLLAPAIAYLLLPLPWRGGGGARPGDGSSWSRSRSYTGAMDCPHLSRVLRPQGSRWTSALRMDQRLNWWLVNAVNYCHVLHKTPAFWLDFDLRVFFFFFGTGSAGWIRKCNILPRFHINKTFWVCAVWSFGLQLISCKIT